MKPDNNMSWNPLKILSKQGPKSPFTLADEGDFDRQIKKFDQLESTTKKLLKDTKKYEELTLAISRCEKKMTADLSNSQLCQDLDEFRELIEEWHSFKCEISQTDDNLISATHRTLIDPLKKYQATFSDVKLAIKRREQAMQQCAKYKQKVQKLEEREKSGDNIVKLEAAKNALEAANEDFRIHDSALKKVLPQLYESRVEYFQPCLEALICAQVDYVGENTRTFNATMSALNRKPKPNKDMQQMQQQRLAQIQRLSIVADR